MTTLYTISTPSGTIRMGDTIIPQDDTTPEYQAYVVWLEAGNGPDVIADPPPPPPPPPPTATADQLAAAMAQLGLMTATADQLASDVFPLAVTL